MIDATRHTEFRQADPRALSAQERERLVFAFLHDHAPWFSDPSHGFWGQLCLVSYYLHLWVHTGAFPHPLGDARVDWLREHFISDLLEFGAADPSLAPHYAHTAAFHPN